MDNGSDAFDWSVRNSIYATILERGVPPTFNEVAKDLGVGPSRDRDALGIPPPSVPLPASRPRPVIAVRRSILS